MSRTLTYAFEVSPTNPYGIVMDGSSIYNFTTHAFVPISSYAAVSDWTPFALAFTDVSTGDDSGIKTATLPDDFPAGNFLVVLRSRNGSSPADTDSIKGFFSHTVEAPVVSPVVVTPTDPLVVGLLTDSELTTKLNQASQITVDNQSIVERSMTDVIAADRYAANRSQNVLPGGGWASVMRARAVPPSATGD